MTRFLMMRFLMMVAMLSACGLQASQAADSVEDFYRARRLITLQIGAGSAGDGYDLYGRLVARHIVKFKIIAGYTSPRETALAIERGEVEAMAGINWTAAKTFFTEKFASGELLLVAQYGSGKLDELRHVPVFPNGDETLQQYFRVLYARQDYGRPLAFPAGVPAERVAAFRQAFAATVRDPEFLSDAARSKLDINPVLGEELQALTEAIYRTPPEVVGRMQVLLNTGGR